jgi:hypothetical protein
MGYASMRAFGSATELWRRPHMNLDRIVRISRDGRYVLLPTSNPSQDAGFLYTSRPAIPKPAWPRQGRRKIRD